MLHSRVFSFSALTSFFFFHSFFFVLKMGPSNEIWRTMNLKTIPIVSFIRHFCSRMRRDGLPSVFSTRICSNGSPFNSQLKSPSRPSLSRYRAFFTKLLNQTSVRTRLQVIIKKKVVYLISTNRLGLTRSWLGASHSKSWLFLFALFT